MRKHKKIKRGLALLLVVSLSMSCCIFHCGSAPYVEADTGTEITDTSQYYKTVGRQRVSVHDPSIVKEGDTYYIFGSHMAWAKSTDLENWTHFTNNINRDYRSLFADGFSWAALGDAKYNPSGNMWAPDVIWNKDMQKWCMYMSINGGSWNSSIVLLVADHLEGDWKSVGTVLYSGFGNDVHDYKKSDYQAVTGDTVLAERYVTDRKGIVRSGWQSVYGAHAIDPCVFYDEEGRLWMAYGSWSGGIYMFRLDNKTGLRDNSADAKKGYTDAYMGKKIGGSTASGEGCYIEYINGAYYMFLSYGALEAAGGYNMRVFSSENPDGPYTDISGDDANKGGAVNGAIGTRLMSYYKWSYQSNAQVAQGHNSAFVDENGNAYVVYHTRTDNGTEYHSVRVHQLFTTEHGRLAAAPFEYTGTDRVKEDGYSADEIAGDYEILFQKHTVSEKLEYNAPQHIVLNKDGTITGDVTGTWKEQDKKALMSVIVDNVTYEGTFVEQNLEETNIKTLCFTAVGTNEVCLWGAKYPGDGAAVAMAGNSLRVPAKINADTKLDSEGLWGTKITWRSDASSLLEDGTIIPSAIDRKITVKGIVSKGDYYFTKTMTTTVEAEKESSSVSQGTGNFYYQDYEGNPVLNSLWTVTGNTTIEKNATDKANATNHVRIVPSGSGNRGAVSTFDFKRQLSGNYDFETDVMLSSSTGNSGSTTPKTQFALMCEDKAYESGGVNIGLASGYILKLEAVGAGNQTFTINDDEKDTVLLPASDWIHVKVSVDTGDLTKAVLTLTNTSTGQVLKKDKEIRINGGGKLAGLYILLGRGNSSGARVDNTVIKMPGIADYHVLDAKISKGNNLLKLQSEKKPYTEETAVKLQTAVQAAGAVSRDLPVSEQQKVDDAAAALEKALQELTCITHVFSEAIVTKEATLTTEGTQVYYCYQCSHTKQETIPRKNPTATTKPEETENPAPTKQPDENSGKGTEAEKVDMQAAGYLGRSITMVKGKKVTLRAVVSSAGAGKKVTYKSSKPGVASVSAKGVVQAKKTGSTKITVTSADGNAAAKVTITVVKKAKKVTAFKLKKTALKMRRGTSAALELKSMTKGGTDKISFKSSDKKVAGVDRYGVVHALKKGTVTLKVKCGKKTVNVKVKVTVRM